MGNRVSTLTLIGLIALSACAVDGDGETIDSIAPAADSESSSTTSPLSTLPPVPAASVEAVEAANKTPDTTTIAPTVVPEGSRYVALGSSYAAGQNIPTQGPVCGRSDLNYPNLIAAELQIDLVDVTCGAATTANLMSEPQGDLPPQIDAINEDTRLVTITAGGNDVQYILTAFGCGSAPESCVPNLDTATIDAALDDLPNRLEALSAAIRERAPHTVIALVTYLQVVPPEGAECALLGLDADEASYVSDLGQRLDAAFRTAARATGMVLVDAYSATAEHGPCADEADRWMSGIDGGPDGLFYHPTAAGHEAMADMVLTAISSTNAGLWFDIASGFPSSAVSGP